MRFLSIQVRRQQFAYSCVAAVTQMIYEYYVGERLTHAKAIRLTKCKPDGAELPIIGAVLGKVCGMKTENLRTLRDAKRAIGAGKLVVSHDETSYCDSHAVLFCGTTSDGLYVCDPNTALIKWRSDVWVKRSGATEFIAISPSRE